MQTPDQALFEEDLASVEFRSSAAKGKWGLPAPDFAGLLTWPKRLLWISAAPRPNAPDQFYVALDLQGYRADPPTGTFGDPQTNGMLPVGKRPKGKENSRVATVFRTDWNNGTAFYHPYDRVAAAGHKAAWEKGGQSDTRRWWTSQHTIVDWLEEFYALLNCGDYIGT